MLNTANKNKDCAIFFCNYYLTNSRGQVIDHFYSNDFKKVKLMDQPAHGACSLINVKTLNEVGGYDEQLQCHD